MIALRGLKHRYQVRRPLCLSSDGPEDDAVVKLLAFRRLHVNTRFLGQHFENRIGRRDYQSGGETRMF